MTIALLIVAPVIALVAWTCLICVWALVTRVRAIIHSGMMLDPTVPQYQQMSQLPANVRWKADNYNHLMEQPTLFYAVALSLALLGDNTNSTLLLAWSYVGLRVLHSLVQVTINRILLRFRIFVLSSLVLFALTGKAAMLVFQSQ
jgi:hypothetical protein